MVVPSKYIEMSGNVYKDLGFKDADERMAKARLALCISKIIDELQIRQEKAGELLGINQLKFSALINGNLGYIGLSNALFFKIGSSEESVGQIPPFWPLLAYMPVNRVGLRCLNTSNKL